MWTLPLLLLVNGVFAEEYRVLCPFIMFVGGKFLLAVKGFKKQSPEKLDWRVSFSCSNFGRLIESSS